MVRLSVTISSFGQRPNDGRAYSQPQTERQYSQVPNSHLQQQPQQQPLPEQSQVPQPTTVNAAVLSNVEGYSQPTTSSPNFSAAQAVQEVLPSASHSHLTVLTNGDQASQLPSPCWSHKVVRQISESYHRTQKRPYRPTDQASHGTTTEGKYPREVKWCPACRSPILAGVSHRCSHTQEESPTVVIRGATDSSSSHRATVTAQDSHVPANRPSVLSSNTTSIDPLHLDIPEPSDNVHFQGRIPNLLPISQNLHPQSSLSPEVTRQGVVVANPSLLKPAALNIPVTATHPSLESPSQHEDQPPFPSQRSSTMRRTSQSGPSWSCSDSGSNVTLLGHSSSPWETPTSLISRLTAGLTARSSQQQQDEKASSHRSCPSPSVSESSDASSFFFNREPVQ